MTGTPTKVAETDGREAWIVALASCACIMVGFGATMALPISLKEIAFTFGWPREVPSLAYALCLIGEGAGAVLMGMLAERYGVATVLRIGAVGIGSGLALSSFMETPWHIYVAYGLFIGFFGISTLFAPTVSNVTRWFARRRGLAVAVVACGQSFAGAVWPPAIRAANDAHGWQTTFLVVGALCFVAMTALTFVLKRRPPVLPEGGPLDGATPARVLGFPPNTVLVMLFFAIVGCCGAMAMPIVHVASHASDLGHDMDDEALLLSVAMGSSFASRLGLGWLSDRIGGLRTLMLGSAVQAVALVLFMSITDLTGLFLAALVFGFGFGGIVPAYAVVIRELFPLRGIGWRIPAVLVGGAIGMAAGGWIGGHVFDSTGSYVDAFAIGLAFNIMNLVLIGTLLLRWVGHRRAGTLVASA